MARAQLRVALLTPILKSQAEHYVPVQPELPAKANLGKPMFDDLATLEQLRVGAASCELSAGFDEAQDEPRTLGITPLECRCRRVHSGPLPVRRGRCPAVAARDWSSPPDAVSRPYPPARHRGLRLPPSRGVGPQFPAKTTYASRIESHPSSRRLHSVSRSLPALPQRGGLAAFVDECWRAAFTNANAWAVAAGHLDEVGVAEFLRTQIRSARSYGEVVTKLRGAQAAFFRQSWLVKVNHERLAASALQGP